MIQIVNNDYIVSHELCFKVELILLLIYTPTLEVQHILTLD